MNFLEILFGQFEKVITDGVFGISLIDLRIILVLIILALFVRGLFAKFVVNRVRSIVKKTSNHIDDELF